MKNVLVLIGQTVNGEEHIPKDGISVKDLKSDIKELETTLQKF